MHNCTIMPMNISNLFYFIGKCLVMDDDPVAADSVRRTVKEGVVPWERFVQVGSQHLVLPALFTGFKRHGLLELIPADLFEYLKKIHSLNYRRNEKILSQSGNITKLFNSRGIEPVFLKGAGHLFQGLYHDQGDRMMTDIDIMVPEPYIYDAASILLENGYLNDEDDKPEDFEGHHHLPGFYHPKAVAFVELHSSPLPAKYDKLMPVEEIIAEKERPGIDGAWVLSPKHQMILSFIHDQVHDREFRYRSLIMKGMYDFYLISKRQSAPEIRLQLRKYGNMFNTYCHYISEVFNESELLGHTITSSARRFIRQTEYLQDHPKLFNLYSKSVYNSERIIKIFRLFATAPFSKYSRYYIRKKIGSRKAIGEYFRKLGK